MFTMVYDPVLGNAMSDSLVDSFVENLERWFAYPTETTTRYYANELLFLAVRAAICNGRIPHDRVMFQYDGIDIPIDRYGRIDVFVPGFCDNARRYMRELL